MGVYNPNERPPVARPRRRRKRQPKSHYPTASQLRSSQAQERQYRSQGRAVSRAARQQRRAAARHTVERRARAVERSYASQGQAVERRARELAPAVRAANLPGVDLHALVQFLSGGGPIARGSQRLAHGFAPHVAAGEFGPLAAIPGIGKEVRRGVEDLLNLPAQVVPSLYVPTAGAVEALQGRPQRLKSFGKSFQQTDPFYALLSGHPAKAERLALQHPGFTAAEAYGLRGALGRGAGAVARSGAVGGAAKRAAAIEGVPRVREGTTIEEPRTYSRDVIRKALQVQREGQNRSRAARLRAQAARVERENPEHANELRAKANRVDPDRVRPHEVNRRVDETVSALEDIRRAHRSQILSAVNKALGKAKSHGAVSVVAQRIARASREDLAAYLREIKAEHAKLAGEPALRRANEALQEHLQAAVDHPERLPEVAAAADRYAEVIRPLQAKLAKLGVLHDEQVRRAALTPYAVRHMGARHDGDRLVDSKGQTLTSDAIERHMAAHGVKPPAYVTQAPNMRGGRNYNVRPERAQTIRSRRRTGAATRQGTFDAHPDTLREGAVRARGMVDAIEGHRKIIGEFGYRSPGGKIRLFQDRRQAEKFVANLHAGPDAARWRIVRINPLGAKGAQLESLVNDIAPEEAVKTVWQQQIDALHGEGKGPLAVIPEEAASRLEQHLATQGAGAALKTLRLVNSAFRRTVLATSPKWLTGNVTEAAARAALMKAGPRAWAFGRQVLKRLEELDPEAALEARVRTVGGGHYSMAERQHVHTGAEQFAGTRLEGMAVTLGRFWRSPVPKQAAAVWNAYSHFVFENVNRRVESQFQIAMLGRALLRSGQRAGEDAAQGLRNTEAQVRYGREVDRAYGSYSKFGPGRRQFVALYTPFVAWALNAAKFVGDVLPRDHPVALAVIASSERATEEWRKQHGLDLFMQGAVPGFLQGSIPVGAGGKLQLSRYLPFGAFGDPTQTAAQQVLPQYMSVINAFQGRDWKGDDLRVNGKPVGSDPVPKFLAGVMAFIGATVPVYSEAMRIAQKGPAALNPVAVTRPKASATSTETVIEPQPSGGGGGQSGLPPSVQRALENHAAGTGPQLPESVQRALERLAR